MRVCGCLAPLPGITRQCVWMNAASSPFASSLSCDSPCKGQLLGSVAMATKDHMIVTHSECFFFSFLGTILLSMAYAPPLWMNEALNDFQ